MRSKRRTGGAEGSDRRAKLVADVGREPGLTLDTGLHRIRHCVERVGELVEVLVVLPLEADVECAGGEFLGCVGDA